jgi:hypothetical protein
MEHLFRTVVTATLFLLAVSSQAAAQETCSVFREGTAGCPVFGAPAATAVQGPSMDGGVTTVPEAQIVTLFGGKVPPNGFMVRVFTDTKYGPIGAGCFVNDNGPAATNGVGFYLVPDTIAEFNASGTFISPQGYKPIGPVSIACAILQAGTIVRLIARGW